MNKQDLLDTIRAYLNTKDADYKFMVNQYKKKIEWLEAEVDRQKLGEANDWRHH